MTYIKQNFTAGEEISASKLNAMDDQIAENNTADTVLKSAIDDVENNQIGDIPTIETAIAYSSSVSQYGFKTKNIGDSIGNPASSSGYSYRIYPVVEGQKIEAQTYISSSSSYGWYGYFVDENGYVVGRFLEQTMGAELKAETIKVPSDAVSLYINYAHKAIGSQGAMYVKALTTKTLQEQIDELEDGVEELQDTVNDLSDNSLKIGKKLLDEARAKVFALNTDKFINFVWVTDCHINGIISDMDGSAVNNLKLFAIAAKERWLDFAVNGGDLFTSNGLTKADALSVADNGMHLIGDIPIPLYFVKGNHDVNAKCKYVADITDLDWANVTYYVLNRGTKSYDTITQNEWDGETRLYYGDEDTSQRFSDLQWQMLLQNNINGTIHRDSNNQNGGYFYVDYENERVRVIVLNTFETANSTEGNGLLGVQAKWFAEVALNLTEKVDPSEWAVIVIGHYFNESAASQTTNTGKYSLFGIMNAFRNGLDFSGSGSSPSTEISFDYGQQGEGNLVCTLHGHAHADQYDNNFGWNNIGTVASRGNSESIGTTDEYGICIFTIDTVNRKLYETRIGRGSDRQWSY